jgi:hypothetical protein
MAQDIKTNKKILGRSLVLLRAPNSSHELSSILESIHKVFPRVINLWNLRTRHKLYIYIYIIVGRSLVLLRAPKNSRELSSAFKSTHKVLSRVIELQNPQPWHKIFFKNTWKILGAFESTWEFS